MVGVISMLVIFAKEDIEKFKKAYNLAKDANLETFMFDDNEYVLGYAKYLIEYFEGEKK